MNMLKRFSFSRNLFQKVKRSYMLDFEVFYMQSKTLQIVFCFFDDWTLQLMKVKNQYLKIL